MVFRLWRRIRRDGTEGFATRKLLYGTGKYQPLWINQRRGTHSDDGNWALGHSLCGSASRSDPIEPREEGFDMNDRRQFLKTLAALGAGAMNPTRELLAQPPYKVTAKGGSIDVHHHHAPPGLGVGGGGGRGAAAGGGGAVGARGGGGGGLWTPQRAIEQMDKFGIGTAILSLTQAGDVIYDNTPKGRAAVRTANEFGAKCMQDYPKRFGLFASIPLPDVEGSLKEIEYAFETLKCDGISIYTNDNQGHWPGDP